MRAMFGLVGILMVLGIVIFWLNGPGGLSQTETTLKAGRKASDELAQVGGRDAETHAPAGESAILEPQNFGGKLDSILVTKVIPGGAYEKYFGLKPNDTIIAIETSGSEFRVKEMNDSEMAMAQVMDAYSKHGRLVVMRDGEQLKLPKTAAKDDGSKSAGDPLQKQLDTIKGAGGR